MEIEARIREYVMKNLLFGQGPYPYADTDSFLATGTVDSFGVVELATFVEQAYGIKVAMAEVVPANFDSVAKLADYIRRHQPAGAATASLSAPNVPEPNALLC
jgi:acyl carrier protein